MEENTNLKNQFSALLTDFFSTFNIEPFPVKFSVVEDISKAYFELRPDHVSKLSNTNKLNEFNGMTVPPKDFNEKFTILLNNKYILDSIANRNWIGTFAHEATHVNDYIEYAKIIGVSDYDILLDTGNFRMFQIWTEFNARAKGYYFLRKHSLENICDESILQHILEFELPYHSKNLYESYHSTNNGDEQMYYVSHFLGRLHILKELYPNQFTDEFIFEYLKTNKWMYELFNFFCTHTKLEEAYKDFDEMKEILRTNFKGL